MEIAVPESQRPINELKQVKDGVLYNWATLSDTGFATRLAAVYTTVFTLIGGPISYQTFDPTKEFPLFFLAGSVGALFVTTILCLRIYLGWAYVGERLLSATIEYEVGYLLLSGKCITSIYLALSAVVKHATTLHTNYAI